MQKHFCSDRRPCCRQRLRVCSFKSCIDMFLYLWKIHVRDDNEKRVSWRNSISQSIVTEYESDDMLCTRVPIHFVGLSLIFITKLFSTENHHILAFVWFRFDHVFKFGINVVDYRHNVYVVVVNVADPLFLHKHSIRVSVQHVVTLTFETSLCLFDTNRPHVFDAIFLTCTIVCILHHDFHQIIFVSKTVVFAKIRFAKKTSSKCSTDRNQYFVLFFSQRIVLIGMFVKWQRIEWRRRSHRLRGRRRWRRCWWSLQWFRQRFWIWIILSPKHVKVPFRMDKDSTCKTNMTLKTKKRLCVCVCVLKYDQSLMLVFLSTLTLDKQLVVLILFLKFILKTIW